MLTKNGFGLLELIISLGLFVVIAVSGIATIANALVINRLSDNQTAAFLYAKRGIEAIRSIRNQGFINLYPGDYGLSSASGTWALSGTSDTEGKYNRVVKLETVGRNASGNIVASGGTIDPEVIKATSTVTWDFSPTRNLTVSLSEYLTNFRESKPPKWLPPTQEAMIDLSGGLDALSVTFEGNYAYVGRDSGVPNFMVVDITDTANPISVGSINSGAKLKEVVVVGDYVYTADSTNNSELRVFNVSNKSTPTLAGLYDAAGNSDALSVDVKGNYAYLSRVGGSSPEFYVINITNPNTPTLTGALDLNGTINHIFVNGNYAYVASSDNSSELQIINVTNPASPILLTAYDLSGNADGITIDYYNNYVYLGRADGTLDIIDISNMISPTIVGTFAGNGGEINHIDHIADLGLLFMATSAPGFELQIVDVSAVTTPILHGSIALSDVLYGLVYDGGRDRVYCASAINTAEFIVLSP